MPKIQPADPNARRNAIKYLLVLIAVVTPAIFLLNSNIELFEKWITEPEETIKRIKFILSILITIGAIFLLVFSIYIFSFANSILRSNRYPPPNIKVIRDTRIHNGIRARRIGRLMQGFGVIISYILYGFNYLWVGTHAKYEKFTGLALCISMAQLSQSGKP